MTAATGTPLMIALGGTISMAVRDGLASPDLDGDAIVSRAGLAERIDVVDLARVGGSQVDLALLTRLSREVDHAADAGVPGVVVTTGTDSIEEVAAWLTVTGPWPIPISVTGSMLPGTDPDSDGPANLDLALAALRLAFVDPVVAFADRIWRGRSVEKRCGTALDAFHTPGVAPLAERTPAGLLVRNGVEPAGAQGFGQPGPQLPRVGLCTVFLGDDGAALRAAAAMSPAVVVAANGAGNVPPAVAGVIDELVSSGCVVAVTTRASDRRVAPLYGYPGGGGLLARQGAVLCDGMSPHHARLALTVAGSHGRAGAELAAALVHYLESL